MYIATSALRISSSASVRASPLDDGDAEARADQDLLLLDASGCCERLAGCARRCRRRPGRSSTSSSSTANSSPPKRAAVSVARMLVAAGCATSHEHLVAGGVAEAVVDRLEVVEVDEDDRRARAASRRARAAACRTRSANSARLARPVTGSWKAWWASCSSNALRSLTSRPLSTMPRTCSSCSRFVWRISNCSVVPSRWRSEHSIACGVAARRRVPSASSCSEPRLLGRRARAGRSACRATSLGRVAEHALDRGALVDDVAVGVEHRDEVARVLHQRAEARLALRGGAPPRSARRSRAPARSGSRAPRSVRCTSARAPSPATTSRPRSSPRTRERQHERVARSSRAGRSSRAHGGRSRGDRARLRAAASSAAVGRRQRPLAAFGRAVAPRRRRSLAAVDDGTARAARAVGERARGVEGRVVDLLAAAWRRRARRRRR